MGSLSRMYAGEDADTSLVTPVIMIIRPLLCAPMERELQSKKSYPPLDIIDPWAEKITVAMKVKSTIGNYCSYSSEDIH